MKRLLTNLLKLAISLGVLAYLISSLRASDPETFERVRHEPLQWWRLNVATLCIVAGLLVGCMRWWIVMKAAGLYRRLGTAVRLGLLAQALNFIAFGTAGGDVIKALLLARGQRAQRIRAMATVIVDRLIGLQCLLLCVSAVIAAVGVERVSPELRPWLHGIVALTAVGLAGLLAVLVSDRALMALAELPPHGGVFRRLSSLGRFLRLCREKWPLLLLAATLSFPAVGLQVVGFYLIGTALPGAAPTLLEQAVIVPVASLSSVIPLPANTLGVLDLAITFLYRSVTAGRVAGGQGLLAIMAFRIVSLPITAVGLWLYFRERREVVQALRDDAR